MQAPFPLTALQDQMYFEILLSALDSAFPYTTHSNSREITSFLETFGTLDYP